MGDIADMMMEGSMCVWCGVVFKNTHEYPVICKRCWDNSTPEERKGIQKAKEK